MKTWYIAFRHRQSNGDTMTFASTTRRKIKTVIMWAIWDAQHGDINDEDVRDEEDVEYD